MVFPKMTSARSMFLGGLLAIAGFLRLWNIPHTLQFLGDQGRDVLIVSDIFRSGNLVFIGPVTSVGNMYLGPLYYYFMLPFLWLTYPSPLGPAYAVALLSLITIYLMYRLGREMVGERAALIGAAFMTFSATVVTFSRFSWNPNPAPFVTLIMMYATYKAWQKHPKWWLVVAVAFSVLSQLHYLTLLSAGGAGVIWLISAYQTWHTKKPAQRWPKLRSLLLSTIGAIAIFAVSLTPLMLFDYKHDWLNIKAFQNLSQTEKSFKYASEPSPIDAGITTLKETRGRGMHILFEHSLPKSTRLNTTMLAVAVGVLIWLATRRDRTTQAGEVVLAAYLFTGILGTALYEHTIFDHYLAYLWPAAFLVYGVVLGWLTRWKVGWLAVVALGVYFLWFNIPRMPLKTIDWTISDMKHLSRVLADHLRPDEKYMLVLLSPTKDIFAYNYRYYLTTMDRKPLTQEEIGDAETLVVINEDQVKDIGSSPIYEIVIFPTKQPNEVYTIDQNHQINIFRKPQ